MARNGKVRNQAPKIEPQERIKKKNIGRAKKRKQYARRCTMINLYKKVKVSLAIPTLIDKEINKGPNDGSSRKPQVQLSMYQCVLSPKLSQPKTKTRVTYSMRQIGAFGYWDGYVPALGKNAKFNWPDQETLNSMPADVHITKIVYRMCLR